VAAYRIEWRPSASHAFLALPSAIQKRLAPKIDALTRNPRPPGVVKLAGLDDLHRIRVGDYRLIFQINDAARLVVVARVAHRRDAYR
jgi:mRNA interferase RelE/StbE